jgi:hypothetical protein
MLSMLAVLVSPASSPAQDTPRPACAAESRQFDFWIGRWNVSEKGRPAGVNHIERILGGCALMETWSGAQGGAGRSLNFFDRADGRWHQTWIDASGEALFLSGVLSGGAMRLEGERPASGDQPATRHRITWTPLPGGKVRQLWESRGAAGGEWSVLFDGLYERAVDDVQ